LNRSTVSAAREGSFQVEELMDQDQAEPDRTEIARGIRHADPAVIERLIAQYQHRLFGYLVLVSGSPPVAEDLFQETWLRVLERRAQYDARWSFGSWLFSIARHLFIDHLRRKAPASLDALLDPDEGGRFEPAAGDDSPLDAVVAGEQGERVARALAQLPAAYREVLVLRFHEELALAEITNVVKVPLSTVKSRLYRGLDALRRLLEEMGGSR
jgi:RNA polymerase sigma-70 factor (ECF subfamily)